MKIQSVTKQDQDPIQIEPLDKKGSGTPFELSIDSERVLGRFGDVAMMAADWFWEMDADLRFTYQSSRFEEITGIPVADVIGKTREQAFAGRIDDSNKWLRVGAALRKREKYCMVWALQHPDGEIRVLRTQGKPVTGANGKFLGYRGVGSDITEATATRQQLIESKNRFRKIIEQVTDIVCIVNANGEIKFLNKSVENILGYAVEELESGKAETHAHAEDRASIQRAMQVALENPGRVVAGDYRYCHKDGSVRVLQMTRQCFSGQASGSKAELIVHARDITNQYQAERALRYSEERLRDFAETGADWFWEQDDDLRFSYLSGNYPGFEQMSTDKIIGKTRQEMSPGANFKSDNWQQLFARLEAREPFYNFEYAYPRPDGAEIIVRISGKPKFDEQGKFVGYRGTGIDITESHLLSQQLNYQASHDPLTGLVNRREFELRLARVVKSCREDASDHALCYIDLDQFKVVNDTCGHDAGDELLRQIAALLEDKVRKRDTIARLGGDEFGLLLERCSMKQANRVAETVRAAIEQFRFMWAGRNFRLGASIGVIPINFSSGNIANVMRSADAACYTAKDAGRNRIHVYSEDSFEVAQRHREMQQIVDINQAFDEDRFVLYQQPIQSLGVGEGEAGYFCEVLVRMVDESGFPVLPGNFLPTAERYNLATQLDTWVVNATLDWMAATTQVRCTINLSGLSVANEEFLQFVLQSIDSKKVDASRICFEITETAAIQNLSKANRFIALLRERGCFFALDDFGSGLSSFAYLKTLPVDYLKIDGFFVRDMCEDRINFELVKSINDIGHVMGMRTIAEFVENDATLGALKDIGIDYAQGFGINIPKPIKY
jgi:diguanylate cyclase (GGDEF)-like protein/PAS domain S-box-containing protein